MLLHIYVLASRRHGALYCGVSSDLARRVSEHKAKTSIGFTSRYDVHRLVRHESYEDPTEAITREKSIKKWHRDWKTRLIEEANPEWSDLYDTLNR